MREDAEEGLGENSDMAQGAKGDKIKKKALSY
jgi:hypothetical protein